MFEGLSRRLATFVEGLTDVRECGACTGPAVAAGEHDGSTVYRCRHCDRLETAGGTRIEQGAEYLPSSENRVS